MVCPFCKSGSSRVLDKRDSSSSTRRRRECEQCNRRFTTYERVENVSLHVLKRDGRTEEFDREKLKRGIVKAVKKREVTESQIDDLISEIENQIMTSDKQIVRTIDIGEMVLQKLTKIDKLGALLFASVYKEFTTLEDVQAELERLAKRKG